MDKLEKMDKFLERLELLKTEPGKKKLLTNKIQGLDGFTVNTIKHLEKS